MQCYMSKLGNVFYPFTISLSPAVGDHWSASCEKVLSFLEFHIKLPIIQYIGFCFFFLVWCVSSSLYFLFLSHIPLYGCTTTCLFISQWMDICIVYKRDAFKLIWATWKLNSLTYMNTCVFRTSLSSLGSPS